MPADVSDATIAPVKSSAKKGGKKGKGRRDSVESGTLYILLCNHIMLNANGPPTAGGADARALKKAKVEEVISGVTLSLTDKASYPPSPPPPPCPGVDRGRLDRHSISNEIISYHSRRHTWILTI